MKVKNKKRKKDPKRRKVGTFAELPLKDILILQELQTREKLGSLTRLRNSIKDCGILHPLVVRPSSNGHGDGKYEVVCGHRRFQALSDLGEKTVPAYIRADLEGDLDALSAAVIENSEDVRHALDPVDRARLFQRFLDGEEGATAETVARRTGCSPQTVRNGLKLLRLAPDILDQGQEKKLSGSALGALADYPRRVQEAVLPTLKTGESASRIKTIANAEVPKTGKGQKASAKSKGDKTPVVWRAKRDIAETIRDISDQLDKNPADPFLQGALVAFLWVRGEITRIHPQTVKTPKFKHARQRVLDTVRGRGKAAKTGKSKEVKKTARKSA